MEVNFAAVCLPFTLKHEGGFVDNQDDPGGATNKGITLKAYQLFEDKPCLTVDNLKAIPDDVVRTIYWTDFWTPMACGQFQGGIDLMVFDFGVTAGPFRSVCLLQFAAGVHADGAVGPRTMAAVRGIDPHELVVQLYSLQMSHYRSLKTWSDFGKGWTARANDRKTKALAMAGEG